MFRFVVFISGKALVNRLFWLTVPPSLLVIAFIFYSDYRTNSAVTNAKPYSLAIDPKTGYPVVDIRKGGYNYQSPSFYAATKDGVFLLTGGFWGLIKYQNIVEDRTSEPVIKGSRKYIAQVETFNGYFPESCKEPILRNLELRNIAINAWMDQKKSSNYVFLEGITPDIPKIDPINKVCPSYFSRMQDNVSFASFVQYCEGMPSCTDLTGSIGSRMENPRLCMATQGLNEWYGNGCHVKSQFFEGKIAKAGEFVYLPDRDQANVLNKNFDTYLQSLNSP